MVTVIFIALSILPLGALLFGALFLTKVKWMHVPSFLALGFLGMAVDFYRFYQIYAESLGKSQWTAAALVMGSFPVFMTLNVLAFGFLGGALFSTLSKLLKKNDNYSQMQLKYIFGIFVFAVSMMVWQNAQTQKNLKIAANLKMASGELSEQLVNDILKTENDSKDKSVITTLLANPNCPESVLKDFSTNDRVEYRTAILTNPNVSQEIVEALAKDQNEVVRYHVVLNKKITNEILQDFLKDSSKDVRLKAKVELDSRIQK